MVAVGKLSAEERSKISDETTSVRKKQRVDRELKLALLTFMTR